MPLQRLLCASWLHVIAYTKQIMLECYLSAIDAAMPRLSELEGVLGRS